LHVCEDFPATLTERFLRIFPSESAESADTYL
jgi:hypothetical protein